MLVECGGRIISVVVDMAPDCLLCFCLSWIRTMIKPSSQMTGRSRKSSKDGEKYCDLAHVSWRSEVTILVH
jgi:hypothetical protein